MFTNKVVVSLSLITVSWTSDNVPVSSKKFLDIQSTFRVWIHSETHMWHDKNIQWRLSSVKRKINDELHVLRLLYDFLFVLKENITENCFCGDGVHLGEAGTELFESNIVNFLNHFILNVNMNSFLDWHNKV